MTPGAALWARVATSTAVAFGLLFVLSPPRPSSRLPWPAQPVIGLCAGGLLYLLVTRRRPHLPSQVGSLPVLVAKQGLFGLWAANEEIVWRRVVLGALLPVGALAALAASTLVFALAHHARRGLHLGTGAVFGGLYLGTGALAASVTAHWIYNALVGGLADRAPGPGGPES